MRRWIVAATALGLGCAVTTALLVAGSPSRDSVEVFVAARDVAAGAQLAGAVTLESLALPSTASLFTRRDAGTLPSLFATHALVAGQLIQRSDAGAAPADVRLVFLPIKDVPAVDAGGRVDLLSITTDASGATSVQPFASGVEVSEARNGGLVLAVTSRQAAAFVYAGATMHLVAVVAQPGAAPGSETPVSSPDQAAQLAAQP